MPPSDSEAVKAAAAAPNALIPRGIWSGIPMPWDDEERLDAPALRRLIARCAANSSDGIYVAGTTGEFHAMGETQFGAVVETTTAAMAEHPGVGLQIGCGGFSLRQVCERIAVARSNGCSCIQLSLPGWLPLTDDEVLDFYAAIVDRFPDITLCVYDNQASGRRIGSELWPRLAAAIPAIAGAKVTTADPELPAAIRAIRPDFRFFAVESNFLEMWGSGIDGVTAWVSYALPEAIAELWRSLQRGDAAGIDAGRRIVETLAEIKKPFRERGYRAGIIDRLMGLATGFLEPVFARVLRPWRSVDPADVALARARIVECLGPQQLWTD